MEPNREFYRTARSARSQANQYGLGSSSNGESLAIVWPKVVTFCKPVREGTWVLSDRAPTRQSAIDPFSDGEDHNAEILPLLKSPARCFIAHIPKKLTVSGLTKLQLNRWIRRSRSGDRAAVNTGWAAKPADADYRRKKWAATAPKMNPPTSAAKRGCSSDARNT